MCGCVQASPGPYDGRGLNSDARDPCQPRPLDRGTAPAYLASAARNRPRSLDSASQGWWSSAPRATQPVAERSHLTTQAAALDHHDHDADDPILLDEPPILTPPLSSPSADAPPVQIRHSPLLGRISEPLSFRWGAAGG